MRFPSNAVLQISYVILTAIQSLLNLTKLTFDFFQFFFSNTNEKFDKKNQVRSN